MDIDLESNEQVKFYQNLRATLEFNSLAGEEVKEFINDCIRAKIAALIKERIEEEHEKLFGDFKKKQEEDELELIFSTNFRWWNTLMYVGMVAAFTIFNWHRVNPLTIGILPYIAYAVGLAVLSMRFGILTRKWWWRFYEKKQYNKRVNELRIQCGLEPQD